MQERTVEVSGSNFQVRHPCGQCMACRITKRQEWTLRNLLEYREARETYFITLTYCEDELPAEGLRKKDLQDYWKRLRKAYDGKVRYYAVGEYGGKKGRPHFHALVYLDMSVNFESAYERKGKREWFVSWSPFHKAWWSRGLVDVKPIIARSSESRVASYVAGYCLKGLTNKERVESVFGEGQTPEFNVSSRKPGIGLGSLGKLADNFRRRNVDRSSIDDSYAASGSVHMMRYDGKLYPLNRVLRQKLLDSIGEDGRSELQKARERHEMVKLLDLEAERAAEIESGYKAASVYRKFELSRNRGVF